MNQRMLLQMTFRFWSGKSLPTSLSFREEANEQLRNQYAHKLHDQYYAVIPHSVLQTSDPSETFTQFWGRLALTFGSRSKSGKS